ncbi:SRPBCC domain-containing protein [Alphaproteobacteria bacterium GH1-50]|uniref:SRPBCC domain-containing protein n=1 Tax=Kangsaoukella pontilimi TaxID=2691042 RepID=A0A7C9MWI3_9RHOB|nr:SRPBCC domain-containing protein [Kangsaoukella pontilimi]MXQ07654.1 SRPBCC domain-containing protein [Kangsaoukella pontilimi]
MTDTPVWVRIERHFSAPIARVWDMWTDPDLFRQWYGPNGMSVPVAELDLRIGGTRRICMAMSRPDGEMRMWFTGVYKEITPKTRLVYTESMADESGTIISPQAMGMPEGAPDVTEVIVDLAEDSRGTKMTMVHRGVPAGTAGEGGWKQAFEKLAARLEAA